MPIAYWCVLIAALLPIVWAVYAKAGMKSDNSYPREEVDDLPPMKRRAYAAHQNAYECFPVFAAAVVIAVTQRAPIDLVNWLAIAYIALRIAHGMFYIYNKPPLRSLAFALALLVNVAIFILPAIGLS